jgi:hypothetical protein
MEQTMLQIMDRLLANIEETKSNQEIFQEEMDVD